MAGAALSAGMARPAELHVDTPYFVMQKLLRHVLD